MDPETEAVDASPSDGMSELDAILLADDYETDVADETTTEGQPAEDPAQDTEGDPATTDGDGTDTNQDDESGDEPAEPDGDLSDKLKEIRSKLSRTEFRTLAEHFEGKVGSTLKEAQEAAENARKAEEARETATREVRERQGKFIGEVEHEREDGTKVPSFETLESLMKTRAGRDQLEDRYGLSEDEAEELHQEFAERRKMLDSATEHFEADAWMKMGRMLAASVATNGLDVDTVWQGVTNASDVVTNVVKTLSTKYERQLEAQKKDYEGRLRAATANGSAVAAKTAAKTHPTPETGGRGDASGARVYRESELKGMSTAEIRALGDDLDRAYDEGRIVPG